MTALSNPTHNPSASASAQQNLPPLPQEPAPQSPLESLQQPAPPVTNAHKITQHSIAIAGERSRAPRRSLKPSVFWRLAEDIPSWLQWALMITSISLPIGLWWFVSHLPSNNPIFLPTPEGVLSALKTFADNGHLQQDLYASVVRVSLSFFFAAVVAVPLGIAMGAFASIRALFEPAIGLLRYMPATAFTPLLILYLGLDEAPKLMLIFIGTVFFNTLMVMDAVKFVPKHLIETTYTLGGNRVQTLVRVITPFVIPNIIDTLRINVAAAWNLVIVAELIAAQVGLGHQISFAQKGLHTDQIFGYLIVLGVIGFTLDLGARGVLRLTCRWALES